jgi:hypothetical protein
MRITSDGISIEGGFIILARIKVEPGKKRMRRGTTEIMTNVNFLNTCLV